jgi:type VI secretion system secreted protein VgrG
LTHPKGDLILNNVFKQAKRLGKLTTALGDDVLVLLRFEGTDHVNDLFAWRVEALSTDPDIDFDDLIGTHATVELMTRADGPRYFDGIVTDAEWAGEGENGLRYNLTLRPWFWLARHRRNQRIFHNLTVVQILTELLQPYSGLGSPALDKKLTADYAVLEYTVQYRESDFAFACRMMERFGISYHFTHLDGNHTMVLTDAIDEHAPLPGKSRPYFGVEGHNVADEEHFREWRAARNMTTGAVRLVDYNFKWPRAKMEVDRTGDAAYAEGDIESFDYPGDYLYQEEGKGVVALRVAQERGQDRRHRAIGDCMGLSAGLTVELRGDAMPGAAKGSFLCLSATHRYVSDSYGSGGPGGDEDPFIGSYVLMPVTAPLAPPRRTPLAIVQGPQTATVVGEGEIDCDEYGRILVRFHWDLADAYSMRCRVSQNWAGQGWGGMVIPRIGMEVVVEFLEGDPDKPLVTGCVYNERNMPHYTLPQHKTKSVFRTDTHQGEGFNELTFEDQKGHERIYMHGQKDQDIDIVNDRNKKIGNDQTETVGRDKMIAIGRDHVETVQRDVSITVGRDVRYTVGQNQIDTWGKDHVETVGNIHKETIAADHLVEIGRNREETINGTLTQDVGSGITINTGTHSLMAYQKFTIAGPGGKITIDPSGITLEAPMINLKGMVSMSMGGPAQVTTLALAAKDALPLVEECPPEG